MIRAGKKKHKKEKRVKRWRGAGVAAEAEGTEAQEKELLLGEREEGGKKNE